MSIKKIETENYPVPKQVIKPQPKDKIYYYIEQEFYKKTKKSK